MSLINKMLKDLEARQSAAGSERPIFQDLQSVRHTRRRSHALGWVLGLAAVALAGYFGWQQWGVTPATPVLVTPPPAPAETVVAAATPVPAPVPAAVPSPVSQTPRPATAVPRKATAATKPRTPAPKETAAAVESGPMKIEKVERRVSPEELAATAYREAVQLRAQGRSADAERRLRELLADHPTHVAGRQLLARLLLESGRQPEAQALLEQGVAMAPGEAGLRIQLARLYVDQGTEPKAIALLEAAPADGQGNVELTAFLATLYQRAGRHAEAVKAYEAALAQRPQEGRWWIGLGISREAERQDEPARDAYRRALASGGLDAQLARYAEGRLQALATR